MRLLREDGQIPPLTLKLVSPMEEGLTREIDLRALFEDNGGKEVVRVGRHPANDIVLDSLRIPLLLSRFHARIELKREDGIIVISDANTTNGTYVDNKIVKHGAMEPLTPGCCVSLGGPANVIRDGMVLHNPFRYELVCGQIGDNPQAVAEDGQPLSLAAMGINTNNHNTRNTKAPHCASPRVYPLTQAPTRRVSVDLAAHGIAPSTSRLHRQGSLKHNRADEPAPQPGWLSELSRATSDIPELDSERDSEALVDGEPRGAERACTSSPTGGPSTTGGEAPAQGAVGKGKSKGKVATGPAGKGTGSGAQGINAMRTDGPGTATCSAKRRASSAERSGGAAAVPLAASSAGVACSVSTTACVKVESDALVKSERAKRKKRKCQGAGPAVKKKPKIESSDAPGGQATEDVATQPTEGGAVCLPPDLINTNAAEKRQALVVDELKCVICHDAVVNAHILRCTHTFCGLCIWKWVARKRTCPFCRERCGEGPIEQPLLETLIKLLVEPNMSEEERTSRQERRLEFIAYKQTTEFKATSARQPRRPTPIVHMQGASASADVLTAWYINRLRTQTQGVRAPSNFQAVDTRQAGGGTTAGRDTLRADQGRQRILRNTVLARDFIANLRRFQMQQAEAEPLEAAGANGAGADPAGDIEIVAVTGVELGDEEQYRRARAQRHPGGNRNGPVNQQASSRRPSEARTLMAELRNVARTVVLRAGWGVGSRGSTGTTSASLSDAADLMRRRSVSNPAPETLAPGQSAPLEVLSTREEIPRGVRHRTLDSTRALVPPWWPEHLRQDLNPSLTPPLASWNGSFGGETAISNAPSRNTNNTNIRQRQHSSNGSFVNSPSGATSGPETARSPARTGVAWLSAARRPPPSSTQAPTTADVTVSQNLAGYELGRSLASAVERHQRRLIGREGAGGAVLLDLLASGNSQNQRVAVMQELPEGRAVEGRPEAAMPRNHSWSYGGFISRPHQMAPVLSGSVGTSVAGASMIPVSEVAYAPLLATPNRVPILLMRHPSLLHPEN